MANAYAPNYPFVSTTRSFDGVWKLTRCMKKAGWVYKASSDGSNKETAGVAANDKWGGNADPMADAMIAIVAAQWWVAQGRSEERRVGKECRL